jgi:hypothetical protein
MLRVRAYGFGVTSVCLRVRLCAPFTVVLLRVFLPRQLQMNRGNFTGMLAELTAARKIDPDFCDLDHEFGLYYLAVRAGLTSTCSRPLPMCLFVKVSFTTLACEVVLAWGMALCACMGCLYVRECKRCFSVPGGQTSSRHPGT